MSIEPAHIAFGQRLRFCAKKRTFSGGTQLVCVHQPHLHRVSISAYFRIGSRYENSRSNGISHFLEHMVFRGTRKYPSTYALNLAVEGLGGTLFAATSPSSTEFELNLPQDTYEEGILLLGNILTEPIFKDIEIERRIIAEEILEDFDEEGRPIDIDYLSRTRLWPDHPLGQSVIGPLNNIESFSVEDIQKHFLTSYIAKNAVICVSGAFDEARVDDAVTSAFSRLPQNGHETLSSTPTIEKGPTTYHAHKPGSQTQVRVAFHAPGDDDPDAIPISILLGILDDGMSTRLHRRIFDERGLAYHISAGLDAYEDVSALNIDATCSHDNVIEVVDQILVLVKEMAEKPILEEEHQKAKKRAAWDIEAFMDDPQAMSLWYGEQALFRKVPSLESRVNALTTVTPDDVARVAHRVFAKRNLHITTVGVLDEKNIASIEDIADNFR